MQDSWSVQIREWGDDPSPGSARLLIRAYRESGWRDTRLLVLRTLGRFRDSRSHRFLCDIWISSPDLAEKEAVLFAWGSRADRLARDFLLSRCGSVPEALRGAFALALGRVGSFESIPLLLEWFEAAQKQRDPSWLKSVVIALGELRAFQASRSIEVLLAQEEWVGERELAHAVLFALGKLCRDSAPIERYESRFSDDALDWQVFQSTLDSVRFRGRFRIEDTLSRIFDSAPVHPGLPLELRAFPENEVLEGLDVFDRVIHWRRHLLCLKALPADASLRFFRGLVLPEEERSPFLQALAETDGISVLPEAFLELDLSMPGWCSSPGRRLLRLSAMPGSRVDWIREGCFFLGSGTDRELAIGFLNLWSDRTAGASEETLRSQVESFIGYPLPNEVAARLYRAAAEARVGSLGLQEAASLWFGESECRPSVLRYSEELRFLGIWPAIRALSEEERKGLALPLFSFLEAVLQDGAPPPEGVDAVITDCARVETPEARAAFLRLVRHRPLASYEARVCAALEDPSTSVELNAVIALKAYPTSPRASSALIGKLGSDSPVVRGRALDSLCAHTGASAKRGVLAHLESRIDEDEVVDKVFRGFDPDGAGGLEYHEFLGDLLQRHPDHPQWEKLVSLRDRMRPAPVGVETNEELRAIDQRLVSAIPRYEELEPVVKLALRAAEQPFLQTGISERLPIDKAPTVLEYCKALDLILDRYLGQKHLFPRIDGDLHEFQRVWQKCGFGEDHPQADRVMTLLGLKGRLNAEHFPLHKAKMMCGTFFNGRIIQDRFKVFDGLRAWAVIFLLFARRVPGTHGGPVLVLKGADDETCVLIAKKLMILQDLRNPAAHRQTYLDLSSVKTVRDESVELVNTLLRFVL